MIICWVPQTLNRIYNLATGGDNIVIAGLHAFFGTFNGFLNALVYSYYYRKVLKLMFCCSENETDEDDEENEEGEKDLEMGNIKNNEKEINHEKVVNPSPKSDTNSPDSPNFKSNLSNTNTEDDKNKIESSIDEKVNEEKAL